MLDIHNSGRFGPIRQFNDVVLSSSQTLTFTGITQYVPEAAPREFYEYIAFCGSYPSTPIDSAKFEFVVVNPILDGAVDWNLWGWFRGIEVENNVPHFTVLGKNYPNPFNDITVIPVSLSKNCSASLRIYNLAGQLMETLVDGQMPGGHHNISWDASLYASGIYFYKLQAGDYVTARKMNLVK
jgi:hypothetical protein